jgi:hypothetical protein
MQFVCWHYDYFTSTYAVSLAGDNNFSFTIKNIELPVSSIAIKY